MAGSTSTTGACASAAGAVCSTVRPPSDRGISACCCMGPSLWDVLAVVSLTVMTERPRHDGRTPEQLREVRITRNWLDHAEGSVLVEFGRTRVLVAASFEAGVPRWLK